VRQSYLAYNDEQTPQLSTKPMGDRTGMTAPVASYPVVRCASLLSLSLGQSSHAMAWAMWQRCYTLRWRARALRARLPSLTRRVSCWGSVCRDRRRVPDSTRCSGTTGAAPQFLPGARAAVSGNRGLRRPDKGSASRQTPGVRWSR
jgi:hypothetical protein